ncbi:MAG: hypothetical protein ACRDH2_01620 [Anaerolineales bacterium]
MNLINRRWKVGLALLVGGLLALAGIGVGLLAIQYREAADYPGAALVADHNLYKVTPHLVIRRDTSYRTLDAFPKVYNWYSSGFHLGPETHAQGNCILMARSFTTAWMIEQSMSVTLCDTPKGRTIFVTRSISFRSRR